MIQKDAISWFEIPTSDLQRAQKFYETILGISLIPMDVPNLQMRMFPIEDQMTDSEGNRIALHNVPQAK